MHFLEGKGFLEECQILKQYRTHHTCQVLFLSESYYKSCRQDSLFWRQPLHLPGRCLSHSQNTEDLFTNRKLPSNLHLRTFNRRLRLLGIPSDFNVNSLEFKWKRTKHDYTMEPNPPLRIRGQHIQIWRAGVLPGLLQHQLYLKVKTKASESFQTWWECLIGSD